MKSNEFRLRKTVTKKFFKSKNRNYVVDPKVHLIDQIPGVVFQYSKSSKGEMKCEYISSKIEELTTLTPELFLRIQDPIRMHVHPDDLESFLSQLGTSSSYLTPFEWQGRITVKNKIKWIHVKASLQKDDEGKLTWSGLMIDITMQKFLLDQLLQHKSRQISDDKISSLNQMASGIAHEINTPLTTAKMNLEMIQVHLEKNGHNDEVLNKCFQRFNQACLKMSQVITRLRALSRTVSVTDQFAVTDLNEIVKLCLENVAELYLNELNVKIISNLHVEPLYILAHEGKIHQAILNLITNAKDAVIDLEEAAIEITSYSTPVYNYLKIKDNGVGIPKTMLQKIFEPFYTTKHKNLNSGIGLSLSGTILSEHNAIIDISSVHIDENPDRHGTEITIKFPLVQVSLVSA